MSEEAKQIDDGGAAFPQPITTDQQGAIYCSNERGPEFAGLSLRDYFAAKAMQGLIHDALIDQPFEDKWVSEGHNVDDLPEFLAHLSYVAADAMIKHRKVQP